MLQEQRVASDIVAINLTQQSFPQVALQAGFRVVANFGPKPPKFRVRPSEGKAVAAECQRNRCRSGHHLGNRRKQRFEPTQKDYVLEIGRQIADFMQVPLAAYV